MTETLYPYHASPQFMWDTLPAWVTATMEKPKCLEFVFMAPDSVRIEVDGKFFLRDPREPGLATSLRQLYPDYEYNIGEGSELLLSDLNQELYVAFGGRATSFMQPIMSDGLHDLQSLYRQYIAFRETAELFKHDPTNWAQAWNFLDSHPVFWYREDGVWETEALVTKISCHVTSQQGPVVEIEGGQSVAPHYNHHYHDYSLDVYARSLDVAYLIFAQKIWDAYDLEGQPNPDRQLDEGDEPYDRRPEDRETWLRLAADTPKFP